MTLTFPLASSEAEVWRDFDVMAGGAAAALTGLILVAVSLHLKEILGHPLHRDRAFTSLQGLVTLLLVAAIALTPQSLVGADSDPFRGTAGQVRPLFFDLSGQPAPASHSRLGRAWQTHRG